MARVRYPSDESWNAAHATARARARYTTRAVNVAVHWLIEAGGDLGMAPKDPVERREWARQRLVELAEDADEDRNRIAAAIGLLRSLDAELAAASLPSPTQPPAVTHDRTYLEAVAAEIAARLEELDKNSH